MNLPAEVSLHVLGFLDRQTLGRVMVANRRLGGIVNRHRKILKLPKIPIPPRLPAFFKFLAFLAALTLVLVPVGVWHAMISTESRLRASGQLPEKIHGAERDRYWKVPVACTTTCDSQLQCRENCAFEYTLLADNEGTITKRNCSSTGLSPTSASLATHIAWNCSFEYTVDAARLDSDVRQSEANGTLITMWISVVLAALASAEVILVLRMDRIIGDAYLAATRRHRERIRRKHDMLSKRVISATVAAFVFAALHGSAALYSMTYQSLWAVEFLFSVLMLTSVVITLFALPFSSAFLYDHPYGVYAP